MQCIVDTFSCVQILAASTCLRYELSNFCAILLCLRNKLAVFESGQIYTFTTLYIIYTLHTKRKKARAHVFICVKSTCEKHNKYISCSANVTFPVVH